MTSYQEARDWALNQYQYVENSGARMFAVTPEMLRALTTAPTPRSVELLEADNAAARKTAEDAAAMVAQRDQVINQLRADRDERGTAHAKSQIRMQKTIHNQSREITDLRARLREAEALAPAKSRKATVKRLVRLTKALGLEQDVARLLDDGFTDE